MDYFFSQILLDLQDHIEKEVPEIRYIDQNLGQLGQIGDKDRPPLAYPALLIDFPNSQYSELASGNQLGIVPISFQLVFAPFTQSWNKVPLDIRKQSLEYLQTEQRLHQALQGWHLDYFTQLSRVTVQSQNNNDIGLRVRNLTYITEYEDYSADNDEYKEINFSFKGGLKPN